MIQEGLSVVFPVYNESAVIKATISKTILNLRKYIKYFEIIAVNDGSTDNTQSLLDEIQLAYPELILVAEEENKGYGAAIRKGIDLAGNDWVAIMDSDGQYHVEDFKDFWEKRHFFDFILGYRKIRKDNLYRKYLAKAGNVIGRFFLKVNIKDVNCGFKLFRKCDFEKISLISTGGCIYFEILLRLFKNGRNNFLQLPVEHYSNKCSVQTGGKFFVILKIIIDGARVIL
jgi:glycosyltransferase involved in cell wall biosynthesis